MIVKADCNPQGPELNQFISLDIPVSSILETLLEYKGSARWVAFYWVASRDEVRYTDGKLQGIGDWASWFTFIQHPAVADLLQPPTSTTDQPIAQHWLLIDRQQHCLYVGEATLVEEFLAQSSRQAEQCPQPVSQELNLTRVIKQRARLLNELRQCLDERIYKSNRNVNYQLGSQQLC